MRTLGQRIAAIFGAVAMILAATTLTAGAAHAADVPGDYTASGVNIRTCPWTSCASRGLGYPGQGMNIWCYKQGQAVGPNNNTIWMYHQNKSTGVYGYSSAVYVKFFGAVDPCPF